MFATSDPISNAELITIVLIIWAILKGVGMFLLKKEKKEAVDSVKFSILQEKVNNMNSDYESIKKTVLELDKKLEVSVTHQKNQSQQIEGLNDSMKSNSNKLDRLIGALLPKS